MKTLLAASGRVTFVISYMMNRSETETTIKEEKSRNKKLVKEEINCGELGNT